MCAQKSKNNNNYNTVTFGDTFNKYQSFDRHFLRLKRENFVKESTENKISTFSDRLKLGTDQIILFPDSLTVRFLECVCGCVCLRVCVCVSM